MPPVELDELRGDPVQRHVERVARVPAPLDGDLDQRDQQRELVGRDELAFVEDLLDPRQEVELVGVRRDRRHRLIQ